MEYPILETTPLAKMEALCNKLVEESRIRLIDAASGKDVHPSKKDTFQPPDSQKSPVCLNVPQSLSHSGNRYQWPVTSSAGSAIGAYDVENLFNASLPPSQRFLIPEVDIDYPASEIAVNSQAAARPCENWSFNTNTPAQIEVTSTSIPLWSKVGHQVTASPWLGTPEFVSTVHNCSNKYSNFQHRQDTYKSMPPGQNGVSSFATFADLPHPPLPAPQAESSGSGNCDDSSPEETHIREKIIHISDIFKCPNSRGRMSHVKTHDRLCTGGKPFICKSSCGKKNMSSDSLHRHLPIHADDKRFACRSCSKQFARADHLSNHENSGNVKKNDSNYASCFDPEKNLMEFSPRGSVESLGPGAPIHQPSHLDAPNTVHY